jgi:hypothetical protein
MPRRALICAAVGLLLLASGCGESYGGSEGHMSPAQMQRRMEGRQAHRAMMRQRARARHRAMMARRHHRQAMARHRAEMRQLRAEEAERRAEESAPEEASGCDPNYSGACLDPAASDYDCEGGSGDGPLYTGTVTVVGEDHYGLDADGDGTGCEPY